MKKDSQDNIVSNGNCEVVLGDGGNDDTEEEGEETSHYENHMVIDQNMFDGCKVNINCQV